MKNILILISLLFALGSQASTMKCPPDTKLVVKCDAISDAVLKSVIVCRDMRGDAALKIELNDKTRSDFISVREISRTGATAYVGADLSLSRQVVGGSKNGTLSMLTKNGPVSTSLTCK